MVNMQVTPEQSLALVEYIAHLSVEDWDGIAGDLRKLGFVPAGAHCLNPCFEDLLGCCSAFAVHDNELLERSLLCRSYYVSCKVCSHKY